MKKIKLLFLLSLLIFAFPLITKASCDWTIKKDYGDRNAQIVANGGDLGGCKNSSSALDEKCDGQKPADKVGSYETDSYVCCCAADIVVSDAKPKFIIPDYKFQVHIPGLDKLSTVTCGDKCEIPWISEYIFGIYSYLLTIAGVLAVVILMAAGLLWIVSGGDTGKIEQAKKMIMGSVTGLLLLVSMSLFLSYINPNLTKTNYISLDIIQKKTLEGLAIGRRGSTAEIFKNSGCATDAELKAGVMFFATGYYKPKYEMENSDFLCIVAMQCTCPNGRDTTKNCNHLYGKTFPNYRPCLPFEEKKADGSSNYCNLTSSGIPPQIGDIAGPKCDNLPAFTDVCFNGTDYRITDTGGGIIGKRIDIWSGDNLSLANSHTGQGILTKGKCK